MFSAEECWYLHENKPTQNYNHENEEAYKCYICKLDFSSKHDLFDHKKKQHPKKVTQVNSTSPTPNAWATPLSYVQKEDFPQRPPTAAPDQVALLEALNRLGQRLEAIENRIFPGQI